MDLRNIDVNLKTFDSFGGMDSQDSANQGK